MVREFIGPRGAPTKAVSQEVMLSNCLLTIYGYSSQPALLLTLVTDAFYCSANQLIQRLIMSEGTIMSAQPRAGPLYQLFPAYVSGNIMEDGVERM